MVRADMGEDPEAENYDKANRLVKSLFTGSRGPLLQKATGLDWAGSVPRPCVAM